ncbi:unnamed protein product [Symbiodinium microadriaticum]|nr:unnamed protein product [Symbiodinium microadriaticum]CAE7883141.1 unnamed protein product [Symbiodinium sp. KB8]
MRDGQYGKHRRGRLVKKAPKIGADALRASRPWEHTTQEVAARTGWAQHLVPGETVELSQFQWRRPQRLRRLQLSDETQLAIRQLLVERRLETAQEGEHSEWFTSHVPTAPVSGTWFHVLAYPLLGDVTKVLLRPVMKCWTAAQRESVARATRWLGETLISQCAKAGQWELVEVLVENGVPLPDLSREFSQVCGPSVPCQRQWHKDWRQALGTQGPTPILELAAASKDGPRVLESLLQRASDKHRDKGCAGPLRLPDLLGGLGGRPQPLLLRAAEAKRWNVVHVLLTSSVPVAAATLLSSPHAATCPTALVHLAEERALEEASPLSAATGSPEEDQLALFFRRRHASVVLLNEEVPGYQSQASGSGGIYLEKADGQIRVWHELLHIGMSGGQSQSSEVAFVKLQDGEWEELLSIEKAALSLSLSSRPAAKTPDAKVGVCWLAVLCPASYLQASKEGLLLVPPQRIPTPCCVQSVKLCVSTQSACCKEPMKDVPVYLDGQCIGRSNEEGLVEVFAKPGRRTLQSPCAGAEAVEVTLTGEGKSGKHDEQHVVLLCGGSVYFFLQAQDSSSEWKLKMTTDLNQIPSDASDFRGKVCFDDDHPFQVIRSCFHPMIVPGGKPCPALFHSLRPEALSGARFEFSEEGRSRLAGDKCKVSDLIGAVVTLGTFFDTVDTLAKGVQPRSRKMADFAFAPRRRGLGQRA